MRIEFFTCADEFSNLDLHAFVFSSVRKNIFLQCLKQRLTIGKITNCCSQLILLLDTFDVMLVVIVTLFLKFNCSFIVLCLKISKPFIQCIEFRFHLVEMFLVAQTALCKQSFKCFKLAFKVTKNFL